MRLHKLPLVVVLVLEFNQWHVWIINVLLIEFVFLLLALPREDLINLLHVHWCLTGVLFAEMIDHFVCLLLIEVKLGMDKRDYDDVDHEYFESDAPVDFLALHLVRFDRYLLEDVELFFIY